MRFNRAIHICVLGSLLLGACGTLDSFNQHVKVASEPQQAEIFDDDMEKLGETNQFVELDRQFSGELTLKKEGYDSKTVELETSIRWRESVITNLFWFVLGPLGPPAGWLIDILTGSAFEYDKVPILKLHPSDPNNIPEQAPPKRRIAIAPPQAEYTLVSEFVEQRLLTEMSSRFPDAEFIPLEDSDPLFSDYGWTTENRVEDEFAEGLYRELGATHVVRTEVTEAEQAIQVRGDVFNIFTEKQEDTIEIDYVDNEALEVRSFWLWRWMVEAVSLVPNTAVFNLTSPTFEIQTVANNAGNAHGYDGSPTESNKLLSFFSGFSLRSQRGSVVRRGLDLQFAFQPIVNFGFQNINFAASGTPINPTPDADLTWYFVSGGYGPELGLETLVGYFYVSLYPQFGLHWVDGSLGGEDKVVRRNLWTLEAEAGYLLFPTRNFSIRFFGRALRVPDKLWNDTFTQLGRDINVSNATYYVGGVSFGYSIPQAVDWLQGLFAK